MTFKKPRHIIIAPQKWEAQPEIVAQVSTSLLYELAEHYELRLFMNAASVENMSAFLQGVSIKFYGENSDAQLSSRLLLCFLLPSDVLYHHILILKKYYGVCVIMPKVAKAMIGKAIRLPIVDEPQSLLS